MSRGGKRAGAGRKAGSLNKRTLARQRLSGEAVGEGITPLELMLKRMRYFNSLADREIGKGADADRATIEQALKAAGEAARDAAPYVHPRLSPADQKEATNPLVELLKEIDGTSRGLPGRTDNFGPFGHAESIFIEALAATPVEFKGSAGSMDYPQALASAEAVPVEARLELAGPVKRLRSLLPEPIK